MTKIGILGGTFDPIHLGHLILAETAREDLNLKRVYFITAGTPPHREPAEAPAHFRHQMVLLATAGNPFFVVSDFEVKQLGPSYTYQTVLRLREICGPADFFLILGADAFQEISSWYKIKELAGLVTFAVAAREGATFPKGLPFRIKQRVLRMNLFSISGREIRQRIKEGKSIRYFVPEPVRTFIIQQGLYR